MVSVRYIIVIAQPIVTIATNLQTLTRYVESHERESSLYFIISFLFRELHTAYRRYFTISYLCLLFMGVGHKLRLRWLIR
jgi:hypothetical protein